MNVSEKMEHFDVAIIGLGPAGSALARKLAGKMQVIALDKKHQCGTEGFSKPCGGLLAPDAQRSFIRDGLTLPVDVIANPQIFSVKTVDVAASLTRNYQRSYININRHAFDLWMKSLIPASVEVYHDSLCRKIWREDDKWHVIFRADGWEQHITARYLVGGSVHVHPCVHDPVMQSRSNSVETIVCSASNCQTQFLYILATRDESTTAPAYCSSALVPQVESVMCHQHGT